MGGAVFLNDRIYGSGHVSRKWVCLDKKTGKVLGTSDMLKEGNIIYADGMLYCYGQGGVVGLAEPKLDGFNLISSFALKLSVSNDCLYVFSPRAASVIDRCDLVMIVPICSWEIPASDAAKTKA